MRKRARGHDAQLAGPMLALVVALAAGVGAPAAPPAGAVGEPGRPRSVPAGRASLSAGHCSSLALDNSGATVFGANLDHVTVDAGLVFVNPRGVGKTSLNASTTGAHAGWISRYASVTFNLVGFGLPWAGMNEQGLVMSTMSLTSTRAPAPDARPPLDSGEWIQYMLDTCATIEEVLASDSAVRIITVDHYLLADACGNVAVVEFLGGRMVAHTQSQMPARALANSTYDSSLRTWLAHRQVGSTDYSGLNGSLQRFCLAADRAAAFMPCDAPAAVAYAFASLERIAGERFSVHASQWSIVFDTARKRVHYRTLRYPAVRFVDLAAFDPRCTKPVQMLDIQTDGEGDVGGLFADYSHETNLQHMRHFLLDWGVPFTEQGLLWMVQRLESYPCYPFRPPRRRLAAGH